MAVTGDPTRLGADMQVEGRSPTDTNTVVNGVYSWQSDLWNGRATYKQKRAIGVPKYLYYMSGRGVWAIADYAGSPAPIAWVIYLLQFAGAFDLKQFCCVGCASQVHSHLTRSSQLGVVVYGKCTQRKQHKNRQHLSIKTIVFQSLKLTQQ